MPATQQVQPQPTYREVAQLARQLPAKGKQKLAELLATGAAAAAPAPVSILPDEANLTPAQQKIIANVQQGFREMKLIKEGKLQTQPVEVLLNELREESY